MYFGISLSGKFKLISLSGMLLSRTDKEPSLECSLIKMRLLFLTKGLLMLDRSLSSAMTDTLPPGFVNLTALLMKLTRIWQYLRLSPLSIEKKIASSGLAKIGPSSVIYLAWADFLFVIKLCYTTVLRSKYSYLMLNVPFLSIA